MPAPIAIAVVSWNTRELLRACLASIEPEVEAGRAEAWVVDNGSSDGSAELVGSEFPWAKLIAATTNIGFGAAVNLVADRTAAQWVAAANADIELTPGALAGLLEAGAQDPRAGAIAPRLLSPNGSTQHSVYPFPTLRFTIAFNLGLATATPRLADRLMLEGRWNPDRARRVDWAIGAFLLVRREAWDAVGGFDPALWMYAEDLDLGWRLAAAGWHTRYQPDAIVEHRGAAATSQLWGDSLQRQWLRSTYAWMQLRRGPLRTRGVALVNTLGAAVRVLLFAGPALLGGSEQRARWRLMRSWARLHLSNLLTSREGLERHR